ncbi:hypothetical protein GCM10027160_23530 [Streptomyces calidiresistens]|uniref:Uncharacterized protein n=1 Tax=Streptomyces calidiresistens TaxID=1485586 RepID=A0A7W3T2X6_9ACTN|nr:hypothetical protein [Streptomyces calidiresistens]MBB0229891.1 hypothetical protein [Streptomyces calidiresistens]
MTVIDGDLIVTGALTAGNVFHTVVRVTPEPGVPTMVEVTGVTLRGRGTVRAQATAHTSVPGIRVVEVAVAALSPTGCQVWIHRTNSVETNVSVLMWREP